MPRDN